MRFGGGVVVFCLAVVACAGSARSVRPDAPTASEALGEAHGTACAQSDPMIVDWKADQRAELEASMRQGIVVVAYDCTGFHVLHDCHVDGSYAFIGVTPKEEVIRLADADEVRANLPLTGASLAGHIGGSVGRGTTLDLALMISGEQRAANQTASKEALRGACSGATHIVRGATVGAFAMTTGSSAHVAAAADVFGAGVGSDSASSKSVLNRDGDPDDCRSGHLTDPTPPERCGAPLRLHLAVLGKARKGPLASVQTCPGQLVLADGKCTSPDSSARHLCRPGNAKECADQCVQGQAESCLVLGVMYARGIGVTRDDDRATSLYRRACDGGDPEGCAALGSCAQRGSGIPVDLDLAASLYTRACNAGLGAGCTDLGVLYADGKGPPGSDAQVFDLWKRGCNGGDGTGCWLLGKVYEAGLIKSRSVDTWLALYKRACQGGEQRGCEAYERLAERMPKRDAAAEALDQDACNRGDGAACEKLGKMYYQGLGVPGDLARAASLYDRACRAGSASGCGALGEMYAGGQGVAKESATAVKLLRRGCDGGDARSCGGLGVMYEKGTGVARDHQKALDLLHRACRANDDVACSLLESMGDAEALARSRPYKVQGLRSGCQAGIADACRKLQQMGEPLPAQEQSGCPEAVKCCKKVIAKTGGDAATCDVIDNFSGDQCIGYINTYKQLAAANGTTCD